MNYLKSVLLKRVILGQISQAVKAAFVCESVLCATVQIRCAVRGSTHLLRVSRINNDTLCRGKHAGVAALVRTDTGNYMQGIEYFIQKSNPVSKSEL